MRPLASLRREASGSLNELAPIPHLVRRDPGEHLVMTLDVAGHRVRIFDPRRSERGWRDVRLDPYAGDVHEFRVLRGGSEIAVVAGGRLFVDTLGSQRHRFELLDRAAFPEIAEVLEVRTTPWGLVARVMGHPSRAHPRCRADRRQWLYAADIADGTVQEVRDVTPLDAVSLGWNEPSFTVGPSGRLIVAGTVKAGDARTVRSTVCGRTHPVAARLWEVDPSGSRSPARLLDCVDDCAASNLDWGTRGLAIAADALHIAGTRAKSGELVTHSLWWSPSEQSVVAADTDELRLLDRHGETRWTWRPPGGFDQIHAARFKGETTLLVAAGRAVFEIDNGRARRRFRVSRGRRYRPKAAWDPPRVHETFVADALALPGGAVVFTVVDSYDFATGGSVIGCNPEFYDAIRARAIDEQDAARFAEDPALPDDVQRFWQHHLPCLESPIDE
jgi:hypothetical protein